MITDPTVTSKSFFGGMNMRVSRILLTGSVFAAASGTSMTFASINPSYTMGSQTAFNTQITSGNVAGNLLYRNNNPSPLVSTTATETGDYSTSTSAANLNDALPSSPNNSITNVCLAGNSATIEFDFKTSGTGGSATGFTITSIDSIAGYAAGAGKYAAQSFSLMLSTDSGATYTPYGPFTNSYNGALISGNSTTGGESSRTELTDSTGTIATGVTNIKFVFTNPSGGSGTILNEIQVFGNPTAVPEPASISVIGGLIGIVAMRRRRASR